MLKTFEALSGQNPIYSLSMIHSNDIKAQRSAGGTKDGLPQARGLWRGGKTSKLRALTDSGADRPESYC